MNNETYQGIIGILLLIITSLIWILLHQPSASVAYVTQEQTPFQWYCPEHPVNCSTVNPVVTVTEKIKNYTASEDGDNPEPVPTGNPVPIIIPSPTTTMPVPEFPFLNSH